MYSTLTASRQNEAPATPRLMYLGGFLPASRETTGAEILQTRVREFKRKGAKAGGRLGKKGSLSPCMMGVQFQQLYVGLYLCLPETINLILLSR